MLEVAAEQQNDSTSLGILDVDFPIHTGFQLSTLTGPLCAEPVQGVCYIVQGVDFHREETEGADGKYIRDNGKKKKHMLIVHNIPSTFKIGIDPRKGYISNERSMSTRFPRLVSTVILGHVRV